MFQYSTKALDKAHSLCLRVLTLPIVLLKNTTKQKTQRFLEHWRGWAQNVSYSKTFLLEHTVRSSLENSAFGNLVKYYLDNSSLLLLEITSLVHS